MGIAKVINLFAVLAACGTISFICFVKPRMVQSLALKWRAPKATSLEHRFLSSKAYLWMVRFVGLIAATNAAIALMVLVKIVIARHE